MARGMADGGESSGTGKAIILIVEQDPHVRELATHFLQEAGYVVRFEVHGEGALANAREILPNIVITEILVPGLDGLALCRQLKADPRTRGIRVLVFSILAASARAREAGADAFLLKPLADHLLIDTVRRLLEPQGTTSHER